jgi:FtsH-binding integral membrane protein
MFGFTRKEFFDLGASRTEVEAVPTCEVLTLQTSGRSSLIMAAYGLYTHIASNKFRSMLLLAGLFLLIYVLVFAGAWSPKR